MVSAVQRPLAAAPDGLLPVVAALVVPDVAQLAAVALGAGAPHAAQVAAAPDGPARHVVLPPAEAPDALVLPAAQRGVVELDAAVRRAERPLGVQFSVPLVGWHAAARIAAPRVPDEPAVHRPVGRGERVQSEA